MALINVDDIYILGETGAQVDKVTGLFTKDENTDAGEKAFAQLNIGTAGSNRNLLDNPWFTVNQREFTSNTNSNNVPAVDRWKINNGSGTQSITSDGFKIDLSETTSYCSFQQAFGNDELAGKTVTISVCSNGTIYSTTATVPARTTATQTAMSYTYTSGQLVRLFVMPASSAYSYLLQFSMTGVVATIRAVKLELGSVSTLANDTPPDYGTELIKCRGYFERIHSLGSSEIVGMGMGVSASSVRIGIPSLICHTIQSVTYSGGGLLLEGGGNYRTLTSIGKLNATPKNGFLTVTCGSSDAITLYQTYALVGTAAGGYIDISADL